MKISVMVQGHPITAQVTPLDEGLHVLLTGGVKSHIGSMSVAEPDGREQTIALPYHKEAAVSRQWATVLAARFRCRVAVVCGIHYDNLSPSGLQEVLRALDTLLPHVAELLEHDTQG